MVILGKQKADSDFLQKLRALFRRDVNFYAQRLQHIGGAILSGAERGPKRCAVCLNAGAALYVTGRAESLEDGVRMAEQLIDNGSAQKKLEEFIRESNR